MSTERRDDEEQSSPNHATTIAKLCGALWKREHRPFVVLSLVLLALGKGLAAAVPFLLKSAVDNLSTTSSFSVPVFAIVGYGVARFVAQGLNELRDLAFVRVAQQTYRRVMNDSFSHLLDLPLEFHLSRRTGAISRMLERGGRGLQFVLQFMTFNILPTLFEVGMVITIFAWHFPPSFAIVTFITVCAYITFTIIITERRTKYRKEMNRLDSETSSHAVDSLLNYETVHYFDNREYESHRLQRSLINLEEAAVSAQKLMGVLNSGQSFIIAVGLILVMSMAASGVINKSLTLGDFVLVNTFLLQLYIPLGFLGFVYREIKQGLIDMDQVFALLATPLDSFDNSDAVPLETITSAIEFKNVGFSYGSGKEALKDVSLLLPKGKTVALVGPSGSGKSTIARLLFRFYEPTSGSILIDGRDVREYTAASVRSVIGVVPQDAVLFHETIRYNLLYAKPEASEDELRRAMELARVDDFVKELPGGLDAIVGERGLKLSGGEKQRVAITRAILKDPLILLFDEATSSLDSHTEAEIQQSLNQLATGRTTLVIAHRLSTVVNADEILVLKAGSIVERGTHSFLLSLGGIYSGLWYAQQQDAASLQTDLAAGDI